MDDSSSRFDPSVKSDPTLPLVAGIACVLFAIPLIAMQFTDEVNWGPLDFVVWGALLSAAAGAFLWASRRLRRGKLLGAGVLIAAVFVYVWAELAVGIFTNLGS